MTPGEEAESIVRRLAQSLHAIHPSVGCVLCRAPVKRIELEPDRLTYETQHASDCPLPRSRAWVAENPKSKTQPIPFALPERTP